MPINQQKVVPGQGGLGGNNHGPVPNGKFDMNNGGLISTDCVGAKNGSVFFGVFPMFVPSLSWQNDRFYTYMAPKCRLSQAARGTTRTRPTRRGGRSTSSTSIISRASSGAHLSASGETHFTAFLCAVSLMERRFFFCAGLWRTIRQSLSQCR